MTRGATLLDHAIDQCKMKSGVFGPNPALILAAGDIRVCHYTTKQLSPGDGQLCRCESHFVKYPMNLPGREIVHNYSGNFIIHPDLGVSIEKATGKSRAEPVRGCPTSRECPVGRAA